MAYTAGITFKEFWNRYRNEKVCKAEWFHLRFPNGSICPKCGYVAYYPIRGCNICQCHICWHQSSVAVTYYFPSSVIIRSIALVWINYPIDPELLS